MIVGAKTILKPAEPGEMDAIWAILSEPDVLAAILPNPHEATRANFLARLGVLTDPSARVYSIFTADPLQLVGVEMLARFDALHRTAAIPCHAITRSRKGEGLGVDATIALRDYAFRALNLHRLAYTSFAPFPKARKRAQQLGARHEGTDRQALWIAGRWTDLHRFAWVHEE